MVGYTLNTIKFLAISGDFFVSLQKNFTKMSATKKQNPKKESPKKLTKRELELRKMADEVRQILAKHNVKPFNRAEIYGGY